MIKAAKAIQGMRRKNMGERKKIIGVLRTTPVVLSFPCSQLSRHVSEIVVQADFPAGDTEYCVNGHTICVSGEFMREVAQAGARLVVKCQT